MEETTLVYNTLSSALSGFLNDLVETYKSFLMRDGKQASGNLINSISPLEISFDGNNFDVNISLASYWKYVENGRRPGKFPPPDAILNWVKTKRNLPRPSSNARASENQIAFLISRKIANQGIAPGNQMQEAINTVWPQWQSTISDAITQDLQAAFDKM